MKDIKGIIHYQTAMTIFKNWLIKGIICDEELEKIEAIIAEKYGLSSCSIYRIMT